jgi:hypothetical protein
MDQLDVGAAAELTKRHLQRVEDEVGAHVRGELPADDLAVEGVDHEREEDQPFPAAQVGEVGEKGTKFRGSQSDRQTKGPRLRAFLSSGGRIWTDICDRVPLPLRPISSGEQRRFEPAWLVKFKAKIAAFCDRRVITDAERLPVGRSRCGHRKSQRGDRRLGFPTQDC